MATLDLQPFARASGDPGTIALTAIVGELVERLLRNKVIVAAELRDIVKSAAEQVASMRPRTRAAMALDACRESLDGKLRSDQTLARVVDRRGRTSP